MSLPDHKHIKIEQSATQPQEEDLMTARNAAPPIGRFCAIRAFFRLRTKTRRS